MIRHIVLLRVKDGISESDVAAIFSELAPLRSSVPGMRSVVAGRSSSPEKIERGYMHGFTVDFDSWEALSLYQEHPDHQATGRKLVSICEGGMEGILVFDVES
jgi:hypothetical protein